MKKKALIILIATVVSNVVCRERKISSATIGASIQEAVTAQKIPYFLWGASTSEHQGSKRCTPEICSWSRFAQKHTLPQPQDSEYTMNWWEHYRSYIDHAKDELHLNSLRFSIEWPLVQPDGPASWNQEALDHYADLLCYMLKRDITPIVCFHHYTDPCWFLDHDGFEKIKNGAYFANFCKTVYTTLVTKIAQDPEALNALGNMQPRQPLFATFNSPEGYAFKGYREMTSPPANSNKKGITWAVTVLKNMMEAHVLVYNALKSAHHSLNLPKEIKEPQIGFLKNVHILKPATHNPLQLCVLPLSYLTCSVGNSLQNDGEYRFFTEGIFKVHIPGVVNIYHENKKAPGALDWIGLNCYSDGELCGTQRVQEKREKFKTDNSNYRINAQSFYEAIVHISNKLAQPLGIPLIVTENGVATEKDPKRYQFYCSYLDALCRAIQDDCLVHGYLTWTLFDNYEWPHITTHGKRTYGLFSVDPEHPEQLHLKVGARSYQKIIAGFNKAAAPTTDITTHNPHKPIQNQPLLWNIWRSAVSFLFGLIGWGNN